MCSFNVSSAPFSSLSRFPLPYRTQLRADFMCLWYTSCVSTAYIHTAYNTSMLWSFSLLHSRRNGSLFAVYFKPKPSNMYIYTFIFWLPLPLPLLMLHSMLAARFDIHLIRRCCLLSLGKSCVDTLKFSRSYCCRPSGKQKFEWGTNGKKVEKRTRAYRNTKHFYLKGILRVKPFISLWNKPSNQHTQKEKWTECLKIWESTNERETWLKLRTIKVKSNERKFWANKFKCSPKLAKSSQAVQQREKIVINNNNSSIGGGGSGSSHTHNSKSIIMEEPSTSEHPNFCINA